jgi:hypothetical protein
MEATLLLCDAAQEVGGKLYVLGGGWSVMAAETATNMALAVKLAVPWDQTNRQHKVEIQLLDADGEQVDVGDGPVGLSGAFEVGRPPGLKPGTPLDAPFVANFGGLVLKPGSYVWQLEVDGSPVTRAPFLALET